MRSLLVLLVVLAALVSTCAAAAMAGPRVRSTETTAAEPVPASALVPKTMSTLPGATYPWVQPTWIQTGGVTMPAVPRTVYVTGTQPPAWISLA